MNVAAMIIGIDGWDAYTKPLIDSLAQHEPSVRPVVIDNASVQPYPAKPYIHRTARLSYAQAINYAAQLAGDADWYIVLSNDVLCTGPFVGTLAPLGEIVVGPLVKQNQGWRYVEGWCVCAPRDVWQMLEGFDTGFIGSSWEDVDFSQRAVAAGYEVWEMGLPFVHLDQKQRFSVIPDYWSTEHANVKRFMTKQVERRHNGVH